MKKASGFEFHKLLKIKILPSLFFHFAKVKIWQVHNEFYRPEYNETEESTINIKIREIFDNERTERRCFHEPDIIATTFHEFHF